MPKLLSQLPIFDINTSKSDILTKLSAFNPYPKKSEKGILVSRISHPMTNPAMWIKYLATGEIYYVHLPISYEIKEIDLPAAVQESQVPCYDEMWMTLDEFMTGLSYDVVHSECYSKADLDNSVERSVVEFRLRTIGDVRGQFSGLPLFKSPKDAHLSIIKEALSVINNGDPYTGWCFVDFACRTGAYVIDKKQYSEPSFAVFEYTNRELARNACPSIMVQHYSHYRDRGRWDVFSDTAHEVQAFCVLTTQIKALNTLLGKYDGVARQHLQAVITISETRLQSVVQQLMNKRSIKDGISYFDEATSYFLGQGIKL